MSKVKCMQAEFCYNARCEHRLPHYKIEEEEGEVCTKWSECSEMEIAVRCVKIKENK